MFNKESMSELWELKEIKDSCELIMGQSPPGSSYNEEGEGIPFLQGKAEFGKTFPRHVKFTTDPKRKTKKGSILMSVRAPVGDVNIANIDYCIGRGLASLNLKNGDNNYLFYLLIYLKPKIEESGTGSTFKAITKSGLEKIKIPVPPLETQKKIVEILEKADKLKEWRTEADELLDEYLKSLFYEMFGDPISNSKNLKLSFLKDVADINMGQSPPGDSYNDKKQGIEFFQGKSEFTDKYPIVKKWTTKPLKLAKKNDILMSVRAPVGSVNITNIDCCIGRGLAAISCKKDINRDYLYSFFKIIEKNIANMGSGSTFKAITKTQLNNLQILIPPIELQNQFAQIVQQVETIKTHQSQSKQEIDNLFNTLMQKAFKGELVC